MTDKYNIDSIKKILSKIENLKDRKHIEKIKKIIFTENPDISITKKSSGILLFFHNLTQETYFKLDLFFDKLESEQIKKITSSVSETYDKNLSDYELSNEPIIKLSNAEKKLINKKKYHDEIEQKTDDIYISDNESFFNK
jgi:hypothetical protein